MLFVSRYPRRIPAPPRHSTRQVAILGGLAIAAAATLVAGCGSEWSKRPNRDDSVRNDVRVELSQPGESARIRIAPAHPKRGDFIRVELERTNTKAVTGALIRIDAIEVLKCDEFPCVYEGVAKSDDPSITGTVFDGSGRIEHTPGPHGPDPGLCGDSDGGIAPYRPGYVMVGEPVREGDTIRLPDSHADQCASPTELEEWYCEGDETRSTLVRCRSCIASYIGQDACACEDSDRGQDYYLKGHTTTVGGTLAFDECVDRYTLRERYCDLRGQPAEELRTCTTLCTAGACEDEVSAAVTSMPSRALLEITQAGAQQIAGSIAPMLMTEELRRQPYYDPVNRLFHWDYREQPYTAESETDIHVGRDGRYRITGDDFTCYDWELELESLSMHLNLSGARIDGEFGHVVTGETVFSESFLTPDREHGGMVEATHDRTVEIRTPGLLTTWNLADKDDFQLQANLLARFTRHDVPGCRLLRENKAFRIRVNAHGLRPDGRLDLGLTTVSEPVEAPSFLSRRLPSATLSPVDINVSVREGAATAGFHAGGGGISLVDVLERLLRDLGLDLADFLSLENEEVRCNSFDGCVRDMLELLIGGRLEGTEYGGLEGYFVNFSEAINAAFPTIEGHSAFAQGDVHIDYAARMALLMVPRAADYPLRDQPSLLTEWQVDVDFPDPDRCADRLAFSDAPVADLARFSVGNNDAHLKLTLPFRLIESVVYAAAKQGAFCTGQTVVRRDHHYQLISEPIGQVTVTAGRRETGARSTINGYEPHARRSLQVRLPMEVIANMGVAWVGSVSGHLRFDLMFDLEFSQQGNSVQIRASDGRADRLRGHITIYSGGTTEVLDARAAASIVQSLIDRVIAQFAPVTIPLIPPRQSTGIVAELGDVLADSEARQLSLGFFLRPEGWWEGSTDRFGGDYGHMELQRADAMLCQRACEADSKCRAWTYVRPGYQGDRPQCWLKESVTTRSFNTCCISGVALEFRTDRPGSDFSIPGVFDAPILLDDGSAETCQSICRGFGQCRAWTYVLPGIQGPEARCWLKDAVPAGVSDDCCVSGVD